MKKIIFLLALISLNSTFAFSYGNVMCKSSFNGEVFNLVHEYDATCFADLVWGKKDVCFDGSAEHVVELMNNGHFNKRAYVVYDAVLNNDDSISYVGVDQMSFWEDDRTLYRCK